MKPFNLQAAINGIPVCTKDGYDVDDIRYFEKANKVVGVIAENLVVWEVDGKSLQTHHKDLYMKPLKHKIYAQAWKTDEGEIEVCIWRDCKKPKIKSFIDSPVVVHEWEE